MRHARLVATAGAVALLGAVSLGWAGTGGATSPTPSPSEATYATTSAKVAVGKRSDWRAQLELPVSAGWYTMEVQSPVEATCWYAHGSDTTAWPARFEVSGDATYVLDVTASGEVEVKCANGHARGPVFVTLVPTTMQGTP